MVFESEAPKSHGLGWKGYAKKVRLPHCTVELVRVRGEANKSLQVQTRQPYGIRSDFRGRTTMLGDSTGSQWAKATQHWSDTRQGTVSGRL